LKRIALIALGVCLALAVVLTIAVTVTLPNMKQIRAAAEAPRTTTIFDANDRKLFSVVKEERIEVPLARISPHLIHAVIAVEDERFYKHFGFDSARIIGAALVDLKSGSRSQGASTITQQLARQMFLDTRKTWWRKWRELALAMRIEHELTKDKILELYLNTIYFGSGYYGAEAASRGYFGKSANDVSVAEAALLAGLIQAPSAYSPRTHPDRAKTRRAVVLSRMVEVGDLNAEDAKKLREAPIRLHAPVAADAFGQYFKSYVVRLLTQRFGEDRVFDEGLRVYTTLDPDVQRDAERVVAEGLKKIEQRRGYQHPRFGAPAKAEKPGAAPDAGTGYLQGALVAIDPVTGAVRALVGGRDYTQSAFDRATQAKRQAGSAFKPFVYAAAIERGFTPATLLTDLTSATVPGTEWIPDEAHDSTTETMTLQVALRSSSNRAAVRLLSEVGLPNAIGYVKRFGFESPPAVPSLVLGTADVSVLSMAVGYAPFANGGQRPEPVAIRRVESAEGELLYQDASRATQVISSETAFIMAQILADTINSGTGYRVRQEGFTLPAGGKTGTTDDYHDAWFVGFTTSLVTAVWVGFDQPQRIVVNGFGGDLAAPIWATFMRAAMPKVQAQLARAKDVRPKWTPQPAGVVSANICRISGKLAAEGCAHVLVTDSSGETTEKSMVTTEYFRRGTEPKDVCTMHDEPDSDDGFGLWRGLKRIFGK
jgi:penicillin-binding protein 1A